MKKPTATFWLNTIVLVGIGIILYSLGEGEMPPVRKTPPNNKAPDYVPAFRVPADNPLSQDKIALGRHLFYDPQLSFNGATACASCHIQEKAFTDGEVVSVGATGELTKRNAMSLTNVAYNAAFTWADHTVVSLEQQASIPLTSEHPIEMGISGHERDILLRFQENPLYQKLFQAAFPKNDQAFTMANAVKAIASFERALISFNAPYDRYLQGEESALSASAQRGMSLFMSQRLNCFRCHGGFNLRFTLGHRTNASDQTVAFHNTGLYNIARTSHYPNTDRGLMDVTNKPEDMGKFKTPTLRNVALTGPYMHDGSISTLEEVIDHYARGGRLISSGPYAGDGARNAGKNELVSGFDLSTIERDDLISFLESLTDEGFVNNLLLSNPFKSTAEP